VLAFVTSVVLSLLLTGGILWYAKRRPVGTPLTWGEAMVAATYVLFLLFWVYGVVPHLWLAWADNELQWRPDNIVWGPGNILRPTAQGGNLPFTITEQTVRDIVATGIYGAALVGNVAVWMIWQNRGKKPATTVVRSEYGRPLVKEGV
jgi:hypothetical protein